MVARFGWATTAHGTTQAIRLAVNLVLTRLLAPEVFGIMLIVNTLRTGAELLSDIGVGQNVIASPNGEKRDFLDTAWTLQLLRGSLLGIIIAFCALPVAKLYHNDLLTQILPLTGALVFILGAESIQRFIAVRRQELAKFTKFEIAITVAGGIIQIALAWIFPNVWGLIYANIAGAAATVALSFLFFPDRALRFRIDRTHAREILTFGKWIFLSSVVYFVSTNFDRLYLGTAIPLALLGVFGVARSLAEVVSGLVIRIGNSIIFPAVASSSGDRAELRTKLAHSRLPLILLAATGLSVFIALSDVVIALLYDKRYHEAAYMLPILAAGVWFTILATIGESVMLGIGRPVYGAAGNLAKLIWLIIALPLAVTTHGILGGVLVIALADGVRYLPIWWAQKRSHLSFARQDLGVTLLMFAMIGLWREIFGLVGLTSGWSGWWAMARGLMS